MEKKYNVIYADPPWSYKVWSKKGAGRSAESHYPTMSIEAIKALPVSRLAAGYWTRANAEICLLATRGHPKRAARDVKQVILSHVEEHSKKPDEARRRIEALMGDVPRIELFARQATPGWDVWGNEVASDIQLAERS